MIHKCMHMMVSFIPISNTEQLVTVIFDLNLESPILSEESQSKVFTRLTNIYNVVLKYKIQSIKVM